MTESEYITFKRVIAETKELYSAAYRKCLHKSTIQLIRERFRTGCISEKSYIKALTDLSIS